VFIVGSNITANAACTTFVNNLSVINLQDGNVPALPTGTIYKCSAEGGRLYIA